MPTLADRYCAHHGVPVTRYARHLLLRSLTLQAQLAYPFLCLNRGYFDADLEFIRTAGRAITLRNFGIDAADFAIHPANAHPLRRRLRLRVSTRKLRHQLAAALTSAPVQSTAASPGKV